MYRQPFVQTAIANFTGTAPNGRATGLTNATGQLPSVNDVASHAKAYVICAR